MPELVGLVAQLHPMVSRNHIAVGPDRAEDNEMRPGALGANLCHLGRSEAAREGKLEFVAHFLVTQNEDGMFLEGRARHRICCVVGNDIR